MSVKPKRSISTFDSTSPPNAFFDWIKKNQDGFFINTYQQTSERYVKLHSAQCKAATSKERYGLNGATQNKYKKICSKSTEALFKHLAKQDGVSHRKIISCKKCMPHATQRWPVDTPNEVVITTNETLNQEGRRSVIVHFAIERSSRNRRIVLKGHPKPYVCEACHMSLDGYGNKYGMLIHVHHNRPVSLGTRKPRKEDFLLLCPNCHAVAHWGRATNPLNLDELREKAAKMRAKWTQTP